MPLTRRLHRRLGGREGARMARGCRPGASGVSGLQPVLLRLSPEREAKVAALLAERQQREAAQRRRDLVRSWLNPLRAWPWLVAGAAVLAWAAR